MLLSPRWLGLSYLSVSCKLFPRESEIDLKNPCTAGTVYKRRVLDKSCNTENIEFNPKHYMTVNINKNNFIHKTTLFPSQALLSVLPVLTSCFIDFKILGLIVIAFAVYCPKCLLIKIILLSVQFWVLNCWENLVKSNSLQICSYSSVNTSEDQRS